MPVLNLEDLWLFRMLGSCSLDVLLLGPIELWVWKMFHLVHRAGNGDELNSGLGGTTGSAARRGIPAVVVVPEQGIRRPTM